MLRFFKGRYAKRYIKTYPNAYMKIDDNTYCINLTMMFGNRKTKDKKLKKIMDKTVKELN
jgi:hypothetical protein